MSAPGKHYPMRCQSSGPYPRHNPISSDNSDQSILRSYSSESDLQIYPSWSPSSRESESIAQLSTASNLDTYRMRRDGPIISDIRADYIAYQASGGSSFALEQEKKDTSSSNANTNRSSIHTAAALFISKEEMNIMHGDPSDDHRLLPSCCHHIPASTSIKSTRSASTNVIVVVPSIDLDNTELKRMGGIIEYYEERQLYHLFLLIRNSTFRIIYITTCSINEHIIRYYLSLDECSDDILQERLSRCFFLNPPSPPLVEEDDKNTNHCYSLSKKVLKSEKTIQAVCDIVQRISSGEKPTAGLSVFCGSDASDAIASRLRMRLLEASGNKLYFGSKQGSREIFYICGVPCSRGCPDVGDEDLLSTPTQCETWCKNHRFICSPRKLSLGLARQIVLKNVRPRKWVVKLNQGFSGKGNASLSLEGIQTKKYEEVFGDELIEMVADDIERELPNMKFECDRVSWHGDEEHVGYAQQISRLGVIAEAFIDGVDIASPSAQAVIDPDLASGHLVDVLSTHEQVLRGQIFIGCKNPASEPYRSLIVEYTRRIGQELSQHGVVGHFAVDFLASKTIEGGKEKWCITGIEINLRQGGTTHPYSAMASLCGGKMGKDGVFHCSGGEKRCYIATDYYIDPRLKGLKAKTFLERFAASVDPRVCKLKWDDNLRVGVVFHLLTFIHVGKVGFTAIGKSTEHAEELFNNTVQLIADIAGISDHAESVRDTAYNLCPMENMMTH